MAGHMQRNNCTHQNFIGHFFLKNRLEEILIIRFKNLPTYYLQITRSADRAEILVTLGKH